MARVRSISKYQEQCYEYYVRRIKDAEKRLGWVVEGVAQKEREMEKKRNFVTNIGIFCRDMLQLQRNQFHHAVG